MSAEADDARFSLYNSMFELALLYLLHSGFAGNRLYNISHVTPSFQRSSLSRCSLYAQLAASVDEEEVKRPDWGKERSIASKDLPLVSGIHSARMTTVNDDKDPNRK